MSDRFNSGKINKTFGSSQWIYEEENIAQLPKGTFSIGVGQDFLQKSGCFEEYIRQFVGKNVASTGCHFMGECNGVEFFVCVRGKAIEIGTERDFEELRLSKFVEAMKRELKGE